MRIVGGSFWYGFGIKVELVLLALLIYVDLTLQYEKTFVFLEVSMGEILQHFAVDDRHMGKHNIFIELYIAFFIDYFEDGQFGVVGKGDTLFGRARDGVDVRLVEGLLRGEDGVGLVLRLMPGGLAGQFSLGEDGLDGEMFHYYLLVIIVKRMK